MACAVFTTKSAATSFVQAICADLGLPRPGRRQSDGQVMPDNCWTSCQFRIVVATVLVNGTNRKIGLIPRIPAAAVTRYGLNTLSDITPIKDADGMATGQWNVTYNGTPYVVTLDDDPVSFTYELPRPWSWTDPDDGKLYTA